MHYNHYVFFLTSVAVYFCVIAVDIKYSSLGSLSTTVFSDFLNTKNMQPIALFHMRPIHYSSPRNIAFDAVYSL